MDVGCGVPQRVRGLGVGVGWGGGEERVEGGVGKISWKFPGNLDRDGEGPSVQKMIL